MTFPLPNSDDAVILIAPPLTVVEHTGFLYGHKLLAKNFLQLRLLKWLESRCSSVIFIDSFFDRRATVLPGGSLTAGPRSREPRELAYFRWGLSDSVFINRLRDAGEPNQVWITTSFPFDEGSIAHTVQLVRQTYPRTTIVLGGVYASLSHKYAKDLGADHVHRGLLQETENVIAVQQGAHGFVVGGRGCPNRCTYCAMVYLENVRPHTHPLEQLLRSVDKMIDNGMSLLTYYCPNLLACGSPEETDSLLEALAERDIAFLSCAGLEASHMTPQRASLLKKSHLLDPLIPLQTLGRDLARQWGRSESFAIYNEAVSMMIDAGFSPREIGTDIIIGHPDQSFEEAIRSMCFVWSKGISPLVFPYTVVPRSPDAKKLAHLLCAPSPESYHPLLFFLADPNVPVHHFIQLGMLSKVLPECIEMALSYLDPDTPVPDLIHRYLDEFGFDIPQWSLGGEHPSLSPGYQRFLSHPWEWVLRLLEEDRTEETLPYIEELGQVGICEPDYLSVPRLLMERGYESAAHDTLRQAISWLPAVLRKKVSTILGSSEWGFREAFYKSGEVIILALRANGQHLQADGWQRTLKGLNRDV